MVEYGQFCPIAQASEILNERWTPLVVRELLAGSTRFNEIQRGVPLMSSSLLSKRLRGLERAGVISARRTPGERGAEYRLTDAGEALKPVIEAMREWGDRSLHLEVTPEQADTALLMWDVRRNIVVAKLPPGRTVVQFNFPDAPQAKRAWWLVLERPEADLCLSDPGFGVDLTVRCSRLTMVAVWLGRRNLGAAINSGEIDVTGPRHLARGLPSWLGRSAGPPT